MIHANFILGNAAADLYRRASAGEIDAQRELAENALTAHSAARQHGTLADFAACEAVFWSRLAASNGDDTDAMRLCAALPAVARTFAHAGLGPMADALTSETIAILYAAAASGNAEAIETLHDIAADTDPELMRRGRDLSHRPAGSDAF